MHARAYIQYATVDLLAIAGGRAERPGTMATPAAAPGNARLRALSLQLDPPGSSSSSSAAAAQPPADRAPKKRRLALVATTIWRSSHAQHLIDRFGMGYAHDGRWHRPDFEIVSMFVDQPPASQGKADLAPLRAAEFGATIFPTIAEALRCGGPALAVDAVLVVGEHGEYATNRFGQIMYPRYQFFKAVTDVFRQDGRTAPVFSDKHLSYDYDLAAEMVQISKDLHFPFLAGSSLPCGYRMPPLELPLGCQLAEALVVCNFGGDGGWFHGLEALQCMTERRQGGESGVASVQATAGDAVWPVLEAGLVGQGGWASGGVDPVLLEACLCRSQQLRNIEEIDCPATDTRAPGEGGREPLYLLRLISLRATTRTQPRDITLGFTYVPIACITSCIQTLTCFLVGY